MRTWLPFFTLLAGLLCWSSLAFGQYPEDMQEDQFNREEILRLGDMVQRAGSGPRADGLDAFVQAAALPAEDNDKWHITLFYSKYCGAPCTAAKKLMRTNKALAAFVNVKVPKSSWSHYHEVEIENKAWKDIIESFSISATPTVVLQPPASGKYGHPGTVVYQAVWDLDGTTGEERAAEIREALKRYLADREGAQKRAPNRPAPAYEPPFQPAPKEDEETPDPFVDEPPAPAPRPVAPVRIPPRRKVEPAPAPAPAPEQPEPPSPQPQPTRVTDDDLLEVVVITDPSDELSDSAKAQIDDKVREMKGAAEKRARGRRVKVRRINLKDARDQGIDVTPSETPTVITRRGGVVDRVLDRATDFVVEEAGDWVVDKALRYLRLKAGPLGWWAVLIGSVGAAAYFGLRPRKPKTVDVPN